MGWRVKSAKTENTPKVSKFWSLLYKVITPIDLSLRVSIYTTKWACSFLESFIIEHTSFSMSKFIDSLRLDAFFFPFSPLDDLVPFNTECTTVPLLPIQ